MAARIFARGRCENCGVELEGRERKFCDTPHCNPTLRASTSRSCLHCTGGIASVKHSSPSS